MAQKVFKTGNSLAVTVPVDFAKTVGIRPGDSVKVRINPDRGEIIYTFSGAKQMLLSADFLKARKRR